MTITADELLSGVARRISQPAVDSLLSEADVLNMADDIIRSKMIPLLKSLSQDYFVTRTTTSITSGTAEYAIPYRAIGRTLRDLKLIDSASNITNLAKIALEDKHLYTNTGSGLPVGFWFYGDRISLIPTPGVSGYSLEIWYELPPGMLVQTSEAALITSVASSPTITVSSIPSGITTGTVIDFIQGKQGCRTLGMDVTISSASGTNITFSSSDIPSDLTAGDYISVAKYSPVVQLPDEAYPVLESALGEHILYAVGDYEGSSRIGEQLKEEEKALKMLLEPRVTGEPTKIINRRGLIWSKFGRRLPSRIV